MADYFTNAEDLEGWIKSRESYEDAAGKLMSLTDAESDYIHENEQSIYDACKNIFEDAYDDQAEVLMGILAKNGITTLKSNGKDNIMSLKEKKLNKKAQESNFLLEQFISSTLPSYVGKFDELYDTIRSAFDQYGGLPSMLSYRGTNPLMQSWSGFLKSKEQESSENTEDESKIDDTIASSSKVIKKAESRQRNGFEHGQRNKWNRMVNAFNENTPWRLERDKLFDFTHNAPDAIKFDEDPNHVYSGEAIWRMYVMDKFYRDYKNTDGRVVGGYINDRFQVFHDVAGNQMELADGERTRKPRPHQYSTERRLEEARNSKTKSVTASSSNLVKLAAKDVESRHSDRVYNIFKDVLDMKEAGISLEDTLMSVAEHYDASLLSVSQINHFASNMVKKHEGVIYERPIIEAQSRLSTLMDQIAGRNIQITDLNGAAVLDPYNQQEMHLAPGTIVTQVEGNPSLYEVVDGEFVGSKFSFRDTNVEVNVTDNLQDAATELGLNEEQMEAVLDSAEEQGNDFSFNQPSDEFAVTEIPEAPTS